MFSADVKAPLILPPMAFASGPDLAAAVSKAGGFGFLPAGMQSSSLDVQSAPNILLQASTPLKQSERT